MRRLLGWDDDVGCDDCMCFDCRCDELNAIREELGLAPDNDFWIATREELLSGAEVTIMLPGDDDGE